MNEEIDYQREKFEEKVFANYFLSTIVRNDSVPQPRIAGCLDFVSTCDLTKAEFCERDGDSYKRPDVSAMWFGWKMRMDIEETERRRAEKAAKNDELGS